ncbi:alginate export family protein [Beijerinckia indica]|nr:alginate export family protein [Beijerinckia indica]
MAQYFQINQGEYPTMFTDRDYSKLADPANRKTLLDNIHYIPLGIPGTSYLTLGGAIREQGWWYRNLRQGFPTSPQNKNDTLLNSRITVSAWYHVDQHLSMLVELGSYFSPGRNKPYGANDVAPARIQNLFVDYTQKVGPLDIAARLGRQEFLFGSGRFLWNGNANNITTAVDGALVQATWDKGYRLQMFSARPTVTTTTAFQDGSYTQELSGVYITTPVIDKVLNVDEYYYYWRRPNVSLAGRSGTEQGDMVAGRVYGRVDDFRYDVDFGYKFGQFAHTRVGAVGTLGRVTYTFSKAEWQPIVQLQGGYFSGSNGYKSSTIGTFTAPFPRSAQLTYASFNAYSNMIHVAPALILNPTKEFAVRFGPQFNWRASVNDYVYIPAQTPLTATRNNKASYIGTNMIGGVSWLLNSNTQVYVEYIHAFAGPAITLSGGKSSDAGVFQVEFSF